MQAIRLHPAPSLSTRYSPANPAPSSALHLDRGVPIPKPSQPGDVLVRVKATTVIRDMLTWPETYHRTYHILGHDFAGVVADIFSGADDDGDDSSTTTAPNLKVGDEVFGMSHANRASAWAEYVLVTVDEVVRKPSCLAWEDAAALPLSAQTAYEALFVHAGLTPLFTQEKRDSTKRVLITGAAGSVGVYLVQLAAAAGQYVVAATSSNARNAEFLRELCANEMIEYSAFMEMKKQSFDIIIDCVGGDVLAGCWEFVVSGGSLITVDSSSFDFVEENRKRGASREDIKTLFFIIEGSATALRTLSGLVERGALRSFVARSFPLEKIQEAYDYANGRYDGRGKIVLTV
ncbi:hypothetical protein N7510_001996 [Penicillium lagena]|uniref:uncharacterized protein n=1 Tax=Penicillium lagena TaxID=94218 RepID=UPI002541BA28|nr:uncharacterized protein N7510_001996 [Penicillium lagena]KAJ5625687.1 hypothetical protein N7510_001996 [Penicillium lagena]